MGESDGILAESMVKRIAGVIINASGDGQTRTGRLTGMVRLLSSGNVAHEVRMDEDGSLVWADASEVCRMISCATTFSIRSRDG